MTRPNSALALRRASERLSAGAAALAVTFLMLLTVDVRAAGPATNPSKITVRYSDAAFGTAAGTASVYRKLKIAARKVCGLRAGESPTLGQRLDAQECFNEALTDAVRRLDRPMLTSVHAAAGHNLG